MTNEWAVTTGNSIGTVCGWRYDWRFDASGSVDTTEVVYVNEQMSGSIP